MKKNRKIILIIITIVFLCTLSFSQTYARYTRQASDISEVFVAKYGRITLIEKLNGIVQENNSESNNILEQNIELGNDIDKEIYIEFTDSEVSAYLFLVIDSINWQYDNDLKEFFISNNGAKLLNFSLNNIWNYMENLSSENKFIFYYEYDVNNNSSTRFDIMNKISNNIISYNDIEIVNNSQINFSVYSIQKNDNLTIEESWNYLNIE